jgi:predicted GNAT superfamily acetyltransferase
MQLINPMRITVVESSLVEAVAISKQIPELVNPHPLPEYEHRLQGKPALVLTARANDTPVGFKVGYEKFSDGSFYSWMGGVLPDYRKYGIARALALYQEEWAKANGYTSIVFKTRNRHKAMLIFALSNGFSIINVEPREDLEEYRIILRKQLI